MTSSPAPARRPTVVLSCPRRRDGAPAVPARWLTRLETLLAGQGCAAAASGGGLGARAGPAGGRARPGRPPRPCPPVALRPRRLWVTEIETWLRDPYAIHARHVLRLGRSSRWSRRPTPRITAPWCMPGCIFSWSEHGVRWPADAEDRLRACHDAGAGGGRAARGAGRPGGRRGSTRIADWVARIEAARGAKSRRRRSLPRSGRWALTGRAGCSGWPAGPTGSSGGAMAGWRSSTTRPARRPGQKDVDAGLAPQLLLEAAMARGRSVRRGADRGGGRADLLASDRWFQAGRVADAVQGRRRAIAGATAEAARARWAR